MSSPVKWDFLTPAITWPRRRSWTSPFRSSRNWNSRKGGMSKRNTTTVEIKESPLFWPARLKGNTLLVLDETLIPRKLRYIKVKNTKQAVEVIRQMKTRAFGQFLVVMQTFLLEISNNKTASRVVRLTP